MTHNTDTSSTRLLAAILAIIAICSIALCSLPAGR